METILRIKNLRVSYHTYAGEVKSVRGVDFNLNKGETLAIVGESGCGKTVTAKAIMRLIQEPSGEIKEGSKIIFNGKNILSMTEHQVRKLRGGDISMIFQDPMTSLNPTMKIGNQISESLIIHRGMKKSKAFRESINILKLVNIPNAEKRANQYPHELSGGMRQRVMIAMALACDPKILIADEPTTALDVTIQAQIIDLIRDLQKKLNTSVIMITHDLGVVADIAHRIQVMYGGKIVETATTNEIFYSSKHPYTRALLQSVPRMGVKHKGKLYSLEGIPPELIKPPKGCPFASRCEYCMEICEKNMPKVTKLTETHKVSCWLQHSIEPKIYSASLFGGENNE
ncbi:ABC transporter ATP-binding protein [Clostridium botulinum]|nr:ABC transporter ATP-binding protein [Clostridium botulinum]